MPIASILQYVEHVSFILQSHLLGLIAFVIKKNAFHTENLITLMLGKVKECTYQLPFSFMLRDEAKVSRCISYN